MILGVNGINSVGHYTTDRLLAQMHYRGHTTYDVRQPVRHTWDVRDKELRKQDAADIVRVSNDGDVVIAHSYGCLKTAMAMEEVEYKAVYLFRPAMSRKYVFPKNNTRIVCIWSPNDYVVWASGFLLFHKFGWAGCKGFIDPRIENFKTMGGHNNDFDPITVTMWAEFINEDLAKL